MKKFILFFSVIMMLASSLSAQNVSFKMKRPALNQLRGADLWSATIINNGEPFTAYIYGSMTNNENGELIATGQTVSFEVKRGTTNFKVSDLPKIPDINYVSKDDKYKKSFMSTGGAPPGEYKICCELRKTDNSVIGEDCFDQKIAGSDAPQLISPRNEEELRTDNPVFSWMHMKGPGSSVTYTLKIVEIKGNESPENAMLKNKAFFEKEGITTQLFPYPSSASPFEPGKKYAWQVKAGDVQSEVSIFDRWGNLVTSSVTLTSPENKIKVESDSITFSWKLSNPSDSVMGARIKIVEIKGNESPENAILKNKAFFEKEGIREMSYSYPPPDRKFESGKSYAWQVKVGNTSSPIGVFLRGGFIIPLIAVVALKEPVIESDSIIFSWTISRPSDSAFSSSLKIVEIKGNESPDNAIVSREPVIEMHGIKGTTAIVGLLVLKAVSTYAWQVTCDSISSNVGTFINTGTITNNGGVINDYTGTTIINSGTINIAGTGSNNSGSINLTGVLTNTGSTFPSRGGVVITGGTILTNNGTLKVTGGSIGPDGGITFNTLGGINTYSGGTTVNSGTLMLNEGSITITAGTINNPGTLTGSVTNNTGGTIITLNSPENGTMAESDSIAFTWKTTGPSDSISSYNFRVWKLKQGQNALGIRQYEPLLTQNISVSEVIITKKQLFSVEPCPCDFVWDVEALNREGKIIAKSEIGTFKNRDHIDQDGPDDTWDQQKAVVNSSGVVIAMELWDAPLRTIVNNGTINDKAPFTAYLYGSMTNNENGELIGTFESKTFEVKTGSHKIKDLIQGPGMIKVFDKSQSSDSVFSIRKRFLASDSAFSRFKTVMNSDSAFSNYIKLIDSDSALSGMKIVMASDSAFARIKRAVDSDSAFSKYRKLIDSDSVFSRNANGLIGGPKTFTDTWKTNSETVNNMKIEYSIIRSDIYRRRDK